MKIEEIYQLPIQEQIQELKKRNTKAPDVAQLKADWDERLHDVMNPDIRKKRRMVVEEEERDEKGVVVKPARYELQDVNRIALPLEQDIVNIQTAFTVGTEPKMTFFGDQEGPGYEIYSILQNILRQTKIKFQNKKIVRSWLSEQEVAEYWYTVEDASWWKKAVNSVLKFVKSKKRLPTRKFKSAIWSPFRGDKLYPYFNEHGDFEAFMREYVVKTDKGDTVKYMIIDSKRVIVISDDKVERTFPHGFTKNPVMYAYRDAPYCQKIRSIRSRLETLLSNFADCLDFNFFPKLASQGVVEDILNRNSGSEIIQLENGASIGYLTWQQSPDMAKLEFDNLTERAYSMTNTPRISFENLQGMGNAFSGVSFKFAFMGAHMAVSNHAEVIEEFFQRRVNFLVSAIGDAYPTYKYASEEVDIEVEIVPFMIGNRGEDIKDAVTAVSGGVSSVKQGIILAGITDKIAEEQEIIEQEKKEAKNAVIS